MAAQVAPRLVALHGFIKKTPATPDEDLALARISKNRMATLLKTSRTQVDRLLDPKDDITLSSLQRAAAVVGRRVTIQLV